MKSDKRHELQKNELADWLGDRVESYSDYFWPVVGGVVVAFAAAVGIAWYLGTQDAKTATAWNAYFQAYGERDREAELKKVAETEPNTVAAMWALQGVGDLSLAKASNLMFTDRPEASKHIKDAESSYQEVLDKARDPHLLARAQYGMARLQETNCQPAEALKYYELVAKSQKDNALGKAAERDVKRMNDPQVIAFLEWFAKENPKRPVPTGHGGMPGLPPLNTPTDLPERPDISLPGNLNLDLPKGPTGDSKLEFPQPGEAPKGDAPNADAPKTEAPPAEAPKTDAPQADAPKAPETKKDGE
ncbi:tetratricopeptide repeat protein [Anatilimnocola sp. NA78]|uniref:tetratricopeptide repeat protein n=1 Tax=Anatilimnocola sp. NA78 TaxID=3415683 RepID=UPI003CE44B1F